MEFLSFSRDEIVHRNVISEAFRTYLATDFEDQQNKFTFNFSNQRTMEFVGIFKVFSALLNSILKEFPSPESKSIHHLTRPQLRFFLTSLSFAGHCFWQHIWETD